MRSTPTEPASPLPAEAELRILADVAAELVADNADQVSAPENTSTRPAELHALGILSEGNDAYIGGMEAAGQRQLVASTSLPTALSSGTDADFEALGFVFGEPDPSDRLFRPATLPEGWSKQGSDHNMWSYVVDELGRRRVAIFYKAAFYDRNADMRLETVYSYARSLSNDSAMPVYDDTWCTREAFAEQVAALHKQLVERIEQAEEFASTGGDYWPGRISELRDELAKLKAWAAKVNGDG